MSLQDFIKKANAAAPKAKKDGLRIEQIFMSGKSNQGTVKFFPILPLKGDEVKFAYDVKEWQVHYELEDGNTSWRWRRLMDPSDYISELTDAQKELINSCRKSIDYLISEGYESDWAKSGKNYALVFGYVVSHINKDNEVQVNRENRKFALLVMPSKQVAKAFSTLADSLSKSSSSEAGNFWNMIFNRESTDRKAYLELDFRKGAGFGYDCSVSFKTIDFMSGDAFSQDELQKHSIDIPQEGIDLCTTLTSVFLGSGSESEDFNEEQVKLIRTQLDEEIAKID